MRHLEGRGVLLGVRRHKDSSEEHPLNGSLVRTRNRRHWGSEDDVGDNEATC
jgi:hypothetical protein